MLELEQHLDNDQGVIIRNQKKKIFRVLIKMKIVVLLWRWCETHFNFVSISISSKRSLLACQQFPQLPLPSSPFIFFIYFYIPSCSLTHFSYYFMQRCNDPAKLFFWGADIGCRTVFRGAIKTINYFFFAATKTLNHF